MTFQEAAKLWGLADASILRNAVRRGRFRPDEVRKSAGTWLVTRAAMERLYGPAKKS
ncbi:MAG TPA: DNA-binding protein [Firmicutes bacterium]|nr:DNA-binding protein [Bacillota bacterium]